MSVRSGIYIKENEYIIILIDGMAADFTVGNIAKNTHMDLLVLMI
jgi:hypothetical protein